MSKKTERAQRIKEVLSNANADVPVKQLAQALQVTEMTIRRDLDEMAALGIVQRTHGKARLAAQGHSAGPQPSGYEDIDAQYSLDSESEKMNIQKTNIAAYAAKLIEPGDILIIDNGSTTDKLADFIPKDMPLTIASYNLNILMKLWNNEHIKMLFAGGYFHRSDMMFESDEGASFLKGIRANKLFLSASGIHPELGMTCAHRFEVEMKQTAIDSALEKILLVDSSKFGTIKTVFFSPLSAVGTVVTDSGITPEWRALLEEAGINLAVV